MSKKFYLTTAIPYVNSYPHLGFAQEITEADAIARYQRLSGKNVFFLTGTDENALKNVQAAKKVGSPIREFVDQNAQAFKGLKQILNLSFDDFIRTTETRHFKGAQKLWRTFKKKDVYKKTYRGLYCIGCEAFWDPEELVDGKCPEHPQSKPEIVEEENYFFRLSRYQNWLYKLIESSQLKITPQIRKNETLAFIKSGLKDFSISRPAKRTKGWGVPVPGDPDQVMYVWVDALSNYITALNYAQNSSLFKKYWPADLHVIGKGVNRFHSIYWPAMLKSANLAIPKAVFIHGYITVEGKKMSKSIGNVISPSEVVEKYGTDATRYYLLREIPPYKDGDFSYSRFEQLYNADLANGLGNLFARTTTLVKKYFNGNLPTQVKNPYQSPQIPIVKAEKNAWTKNHQALAKYRFDHALKATWQVVEACNKYIDHQEPWELAKKKDKKLNQIVYNLLEGLHQIAWLLAPFLPETSQEMARRLGIKTLQKKQPNFKDSYKRLSNETKITVGKPLFPRIK